MAAAEPATGDEKCSGQRRQLLDVESSQSGTPRRARDAGRSQLGTPRGARDAGREDEATRERFRVYKEV